MFVKEIIGNKFDVQSLYLPKINKQNGTHLSYFVRLVNMVPRCVSYTHIYVTHVHCTHNAVPPFSFTILTNRNGFFPFLPLSHSSAFLVYRKLSANMHTHFHLRSSIILMSLFCFVDECLACSLSGCARNFVIWQVCHSNRNAFSSAS